MVHAPIALFTYNRPGHALRTIEALRKNKLADQSQLIIFSDGAKDEAGSAMVNKLRGLLRQIDGFKSVQLIERSENLGLGNNIIDGVRQLIDQFGRAIILEDDLLTSPYFLQYMNEALEKYQQIDEVISVHGYRYPVNQILPETFFLRGADCLGWATWKRGWDLFEPDGSKLLAKLIESKQQNLFDFDNSYPYTQMLKDQIAGKNNSWAIRWYASAFLLNKLTLYPGRSLVHHIGGDGSGTNTGFDDSLAVEISKNPIEVLDIPLVQNEITRMAFVDFFRKQGNPTIWYRIKRKLKKILLKNNGTTE
jgi:hypothetical protein